MGQPSATGAGKPGDHPETIKETLISIVIAFTMAFVFRGFVIEAFVIPTGSMAPTLMGAHMKFRGRETGAEWAVQPWDYINNDPNAPANPQDGRSVRNPPAGVTVHDPISGDQVHKSRAALYSGDRILVLKYLYMLTEPSRYDVIVFKNPTNPDQNYIKRLIGLPNEDVAIVDGDVFTRTRTAGVKDVPGKSAWEQEGWTIARKPSLEQRATWQTVFDAGMAAPTATSDRTPWASISPDSGFVTTGQMYTFKGGEGELVFDQTRVRVNDTSVLAGGIPRDWSIDDYYPYDEHPMRPTARFPVSDVRVRVGVEPTSSTPVSVGVKLSTRGQEYELAITGTKAEIRAREVVGGAGVKGDWRVAASGTCPAFESGTVTNVEFWHADQAMSIWVGRTKVAEYRYDWSPATRILMATGKSIEELSVQQAGKPPLLAQASTYQRASVKLNVSGGSCSLHRLALDRDIHYQPWFVGTQQNGVMGNSLSPQTTMRLGADDYFVCGDNSPASLDGRLWTTVDPWVNFEFRKNPAESIQIGVVPRELLLGKAFFVYLPSLKYEAKPVPVPDFGRMRFIW